MDMNENMGQINRTAKIVGTLFITATVTALISGVFLGTTLDGANYLTAVDSNGTQLSMAVVFELVLAVSVIGIGFMFYPILKKQNESLALGYACIRLTEAIFIVVASVSLLSLMTISQQYVAGGADASNYQPVGHLLLAFRDWSYLIGTLIFLGLGGLILNYVLFRSKLVPRWLSGWGLIGAALVLIYGLGGLFGLSNDLTSPEAILAVPIAVEEMVFAVWLIVKGFDPSAIAAGTTGQI